MNYLCPVPSLCVRPSSHGSLQLLAFAASEVVPPADGIEDEVLKTVRVQHLLRAQHHVLPAVGEAKQPHE